MIVWYRETASKVWHSRIDLVDCKSFITRESREKSSFLRCRAIGAEEMTSGLALWAPDWYCFGFGPVIRPKQIVQEIETKRSVWFDKARSFTSRACYQLHITASLAHAQRATHAKYIFKKHIIHKWVKLVKLFHHCPIQIVIYLEVWLDRCDLFPFCNKQLASSQIPWTTDLIGFELSLILVHFNSAEHLFNCFRRSSWVIPHV